MNRAASQNTHPNNLYLLQAVIVITLSILSYSCNSITKQSEQVVIPATESINPISLDEAYTTPTSTSINYVLPRDLNPLDLAERLLHNSPTFQEIRGKSLTPQQIGKTSQFWVTDAGIPQARLVEASLVEVSDNFYWYFENGAQNFEHQLEDTIQVVEKEILPTLIKVLGGSWIPGPNKDQKLTVLHAQFGGPGGYFHSRDMYPKFVYNDSNERVMIYLNQIEQIPFGSTEYLSLLTHELQHAIHWAKDPTEETWVQEGLSEVVKPILKYPLSFTDQFDLSQTPTSLNFWPADSTSLLPYYGGSTRFFEYLISHYGGTKILESLLAIDQDGIQGINALLKQMNYSETFDDIFENWIIANVLDLPSGIYSYPDTDIRNNRWSQENKQFGAVPSLTTSTPLTGQIPQYAAQYISFQANSPSILSFEGDANISVLPTNLVTPFCWWSNRGDSINTSLTKSFDLTNVDHASLKLTTWYEIEEDWDYAYIEVSEKTSSTWDIIPGNKHSEAKTHRPFGPGYSGSSNGWITDEFDLSEYSGERISVRLEYVTDEGIHDSGLCLASASIPEINYEYVAEYPGAWTSEGFVFTDNRIEQNYSVQVILFTEPIQVFKLMLDDANKGLIELPELGDGYDKGMIVIAPMNSISSEPASYSVGLSKSPE